MTRQLMKRKTHKALMVHKKRVYLVVKCGATEYIFLCSHQNYNIDNLKTASKAIENLTDF
jgi:hypothetical protein